MRALVCLVAAGAAALAGTAWLVVAAPEPAGAACCYFAAQDKDILQPGQKAFITWDPDRKLESFTVQPKFEGNALDFGMVIPTPARPKLDEMPRDFFKDLAIYTILMPLPEAIWTYLGPYPTEESATGGSAEYDDPSAQARTVAEGVRVLEAGVVGSLDYKIIVAEDSAALYDWLKQNGYSYAGDEATLGFYIAKRWIFTVMKIDPRQMKKAAGGSYTGEVTPTRFTFATDTCIYPLKITQISVKDKTDALFYVQAPQQMDLEGDLSWKHSYRVMVLTFLLGCGASPAEQEELQARTRWIEQKRAKDPGFDTTKLEWARLLGPSDLGVLEEPAARYAQMGADYPPGAAAVTRKQFLDEVWADYQALPQDQRGGDEAFAKQQLDELRGRYDPAKGAIVRFEKPHPQFGTKFVWYPHREAPESEVAGLTRLRGHLQEGRWLTKFRKLIRKDEMQGDLVLVPVPPDHEDHYVRIMPTSPP